MGADKIFPVTVAAVCLVLLVRLALGEPRRARLDRACLRAWGTMASRAQALWHWRSRREAAAQARQAAQDAIERARHRVDKEGNVYTPDAFKRPRKPH